MIVIAVDPGGTTGLAFWDAATGQPCFHDEPRERRDTLAMVEDLHAWATANTVFVVEDFKITARTAQLSQQTTALEVIGAIKYLCWITNAKMTLQRPGDAKRFATDARLKKAGLWSKGGGGHGNDAARHLLLWLVKHGHLNILEVDDAEG